MKERIYTIPISEAFAQDSECPLCLCEKKLENDAIEYTLGPSMMEPDRRIETNRTGFCGKHFAKLYNAQQNRLALGLVIDTHMTEQNEHLKNLYQKHAQGIEKEIGKGILDSKMMSLTGKKTVSEKFLEDMLAKLEELEASCAVCDRISNSMDKFIDVTLYLFFKEPDFRKRFEESQGFCIKHMKMMLAMLRKKYNTARQADFISSLMPIQIKNLNRVQEDVNYFTKMFDYRSQGADWKNSRDAIPRSIEKISGPCDLQR